MQNGSVIRAERLRGPDVWEFRWREPGADGKRKHRRMILGSIEQLADEAAARQAIATTQELLRHASSRVTLDTYTQAVTVQKRRAQTSVIRLLKAYTTAAG
jgi:hypothetical protein